MFIYPNEYFNKVEEITIEFLKKNKIKEGSQIYLEILYFYD